MNQDTEPQTLETNLYDCVEMINLNLNHDMQQEEPLHFDDMVDENILRCELLLPKPLKLCSLKLKQSSSEEIYRDLKQNHEYYDSDGEKKVKQNDSIMQIECLKKKTELWRYKSKNIKQIIHSGEIYKSFTVVEQKKKKKQYSLIRKFRSLQISNVQLEKKEIHS